MQNRTIPQPPTSAMGFVSSDIDRKADLRPNSEAITNLQNAANARFIGIVGDAVRCEGETPVYARPANVTEKIFLGLDAGSNPWFAYRADAASHTLGLRAFMLSANLPPEEMSRFAQARSLVHWHERHGFCANCGASTNMQDSGYRRQCPKCQAEHFPRTDPVVIMAAVHEGAVLLGRQTTWPPGMYSALAGFMEPGETIEQAVARETWEEAGVRVTDVRYVASQPWPFPASLMIGAIARAEHRTLNVDKTELEDARWFEPGEVRQMLARTHKDNLYAAHPYAIAHHIITETITPE
jgi:NAD+ diphosphatase